MKNKVLAILICALMVVSVLPLGAMAATEVTVTPKAGEYFLKMERTLANGELTIATLSFTPEASVEYKISADGFVPKGTSASFGICLVESANRESAKLGAAISFSAATNGWETKEVTFTGDGNTYVFRFGFSKGSSTGVVFLDNLKLVKVSEPETNLVPNGDFEAEFISTNITANSESVPYELPGAGFGYYKGANNRPVNGTMTRVASDVVIIPDLQQVSFQDFEADGLDVNTSASYRVRDNRGTLSIATDPAGGTNKVMKVTSVASECFAPLGMASAGVPKTQNIYSPLSTLKLSFKLYVPAQTAKMQDLEADGKPYSVDYVLGGTSDKKINFELNYTNTYGGTGSMSGRARPSVNLGKDDFGKWLQVEAYLLGFQEDTPNLTMPTVAVTDEGVITTAGVILDFYVDDIKLEQILAEGYASSLKVNHVTAAGRPYTQGTIDGNWAVLATGTLDTSYKKTETVCPIIAYSPESYSGKALAMAMVYEVSGDECTLVDIKFQEVGRVELTSLAGSSPLQSGIAVNDLAIDLSEKEFNVGSTYKVEYALWSYAGLAPLAQSVTFDIVD